MSDKEPFSPIESHPEAPIATGEVPLIQKLQLSALEHPKVTRAAFIGGSLVAAASAIGLAKHFGANSEPSSHISATDELNKIESSELKGNSEIIFLGRNEDDELSKSDVAQYLDILNLKTVYNQTDDIYFDPRIHEYQPGLTFEDPKNLIRTIAPNMPAENVRVVRFGIKSNNEYSGADGIRMRLDDPEDPENPFYVWLAFVDKNLSTPSNPIFVDENGTLTQDKINIISPIYMDTAPVKNKS